MTPPPPGAPAQCEACPWRKGATTRDIPGYSRERHKSLRSTLAVEGQLAAGPKMACHHSPEDAPRVCVGWLHHQLTVGNNIALRLQVLRDPVLGRYTLRGEQRGRFEDTFHSGPKARRKP